MSAISLIADMLICNKKVNKLLALQGRAFVYYFASPTYK